MEKKLTFEDLKKADEVLDTLFFGRPLGLFGQKLFNGNAESLEKDLKKHLQDKGIIEDDRKKSIIGCRARFYFPVSATNLSTREKNVTLKGGVTMDVCSEPYTKYDWGGFERLKFFKVKSPDTSCIYEVPFKESYILPFGE